ncbi:MAG: DNA polymerase III subunit gamma/tau [Defluviitaleaceae bacterium]|nr:DNA polymerase III subunit gamma/tau [Defluviitaleaceae bacterium]
MPHTALYRKKRPQKLGEIVGQPHIVRALKNQLISGQVSHAYLFCGTRGTGKTTAARIMARAVNCLNMADGEPCNICEACQNILNERSLDVAEIDAASNNGVENIRDLREEVKFSPTQCRYRVYVIDEVHMLSTSAFNALLKTLEEPPPHVIFILATTDPQKIPDTILSRCQRYDFRRISAADVVTTLKRYLDAEAIKYEEAALDYIAYHSDGAMRDALSLLDQCISLGTGEGLMCDRVLEVLGAVDRAKLFQLTDALFAKDSRAVMQVISQAMDDGRDVAQFAADLVRHFRDVLVASLTDRVEELDISVEIAGRLKEQGSRVSGQELMEYIYEFSDLLREMRFVPHMRTAFEVCALKICVPRVQLAQVAGNAIAQVAVAMPSSGTLAVAAPPQLMANDSAGQEPSSAPDASPIEAAPSEIIPGTLDAIAASWHSIAAGLPMPLRSWCNHAGARVLDGVLQIICNNDASLQLIKKQQTNIREAIAEKFNLSTPPNLAFVVDEAYNDKPKNLSKAAAFANPAPPPAAAPASAPPPEMPPLDWQETAETAPPATDDWAAFGQPMMDDEAW